MTHRLIVFAALLSLYSCSHQSRVVKVDRSWSTDYAKSACNSLKQTGKFCVDIEAVTESSQFINAVEDAMRREPSCHGVRLNDEAEKNYWQLIVDFVPDINRQKWTLVYLEKAKTGGGEGDATEIAKGVCLTVLGKGAE